MNFERIHKIYYVLFILLVVLTVFYSALFAGILSVDDQRLVTDLFNLDSWSLKGVFIRGGGYYYRPISRLTFLADKFLSGPHESFMHLENILLHATSCILVFFISSRLARLRGLESPAVPLVAALLFGLHPITTEPVNWISGRTDLLAAVFLLTSLLLLLRHLASNGMYSLAAACCSFFLATLAKETALFWFPAVLFFVHCYRREHADVSTGIKRRSGHGSPLVYVVLSLVPLAYFVLRHAALSRKDQGISIAVRGAVAGSFDVMNKLRITLKVFGFYLKKLILPLPLNFAIVQVSNWYVPVGIAGIVFCCYLLYRRGTLGALQLIGISIITPALLVPLGRMAWTPLAERYLYMPAAFVVMSLVILAAERLRGYNYSQMAVVIPLLLLITGSGYTTYRRNIVWQSNLTLFQDCVEQSPDCPAAWNELARALQNEGRTEEAMRIFRKNTLESSDKYRIVTTTNQAAAMADAHDVTGAIALLLNLHYTRSEPFYDYYLRQLLYFYGLLEQKQTSQKELHAIRMKQIDLTSELQSVTGDPYLLYRLGQLYLSVKDERNAATYFAKAFEKSPDNAYYKEPARKLAARLSR